MWVDLQADALYFQALENGAQFAIHEERVIHPDFQSHFGARARAGIGGGGDEWLLSLSYLHYHARTKRDAWDQLWRLHMGLADIDLSRCWQTSNTLSLTPLCGLRYGEIRHKLREEGGVCMKNKFFGIGPRMGFEGAFSFCGFWELFLDGGVSLLFGKFYVHQDRPPMKFYDDHYQNKPVFESALGVRGCFGAFYAQAAFEIYLFPGQNQLGQFTSIPGKYVTNQGDLSLHGVSFGLGAQF